MATRDFYDTGFPELRLIPAVRLTGIACFSMALSMYLYVRDPVLKGLHLLQIRCHVIHRQPWKI